MRYNQSIYSSRKNNLQQQCKMFVSFLCKSSLIVNKCGATMYRCGMLQSYLWGGAVELAGHALHHLKHETPHTLTRLPTYNMG